MEHVLHREPSSSLPTVRDVAWHRPFAWLRAGWRDLVRQPGLALGYGGFVALAGWILLTVAWTGAAHLVPALLGGFLLVAPIVAVGLYAIAQQLEETGRVSTSQAAVATRPHLPMLALFGLVLALALIAWERVAAIVFALSYGGEVPALERFAAELLTVPAHRDALLALVAAGALFALAVYASGVVAAPMIYHRGSDPVTAIVTSWRVCLRNAAAALVWAVCLALLVALGFATLMLGLVVVFPWLAFASWHAYRDLVG
ncbi:DUF2189 domain-containing protein [Calidifontimicrobium sp. SYSU G02091]|uniref:DUF2189 domain-containing protein n=1 Tax=Calidifontimicrobium sp. SYSU G02091 TaxID=2926421 RepID=UPI001F530DA1|nr:DUF2189 domain-containing protein [Calidifontimicrobium sp. SYSU G02091]MCI1193593.1 DUF2189 domain-containing protein [Calidifontimicrobium sp. SYSU G02091]